MNLVIYLMAKGVRDSHGLHVEESLFREWHITSDSCGPKAYNIAKLLFLPHRVMLDIARSYPSSDISYDCMTFSNKNQAEDCLRQIIYRALFNALMYDKTDKIIITTPEKNVEDERREV